MLSIAAYLARNSCSISFNLTLSFSICTLSSCNYVCFLCIRMSGVHPCIVMLHGGRCPVVVDVPRSGGDMVVASAERACCVVTVDGGAFGCAGTPCGIVACSGDEICGILLDLGLLVLCLMTH